MRLVDADETYKVLTNYYHHKTEIQHKALKEAIERVPTVDAVEVVRCKDCKWCEERQGRTGNVYNLCVYLNTWVDEDHFCSCGERREDENN